MANSMVDPSLLESGHQHHQHAPPSFEIEASPCLNGNIFCGAILGPIFWLMTWFFMPSLLEENPYLPCILCGFGITISLFCVGTSHRAFQPLSKIPLILIATSCGIMLIATFQNMIGVEVGGDSFFAIFGYAFASSLVASVGFSIYRYPKWWTVSCFKSAGSAASDQVMANNMWQSKFVDMLVSTGMFSRPAPNPNYGQIGGHSHSHSGGG